jgi:hypothetical protein
VNSQNRHRPGRPFRSTARFALERIIAEAFAAEPQRAFSLDELARLAYPEASAAKRRRSAVLRAATQVAHCLGWVRSQRPRRPVMFANPRCWPTADAPLLCLMMHCENDAARSQSFMPTM